MPKIEAIRTPVTAEEVFCALWFAWVRRFGETPTRKSIILLTAQWALETGHGRSMWCYNLGNIKSRGVTGLWCFFRCNEIIDGKEVWFEPDHKACCFRAYRTLEDGAEDYLKTLYERFTLAWPEVVAGNPTHFVAKLKAQNYFTASLAKYTDAVVSLCKSFERKIPTDAPVVLLHVPETPTLRINTMGEAVRRLTTALAGLTFLGETEITSTFGETVEAAVIEFQKSRGLVEDGIVGRLTWAALLDATAQPAEPTPPPVSDVPLTGNPVRMTAVARGTAAARSKV